MIGKQAVVIEVRGSKVVVLTQRGEFLTLRAPGKNVAVGELIDIPASSFGYFVPRLAIVFGLTLAVLVASLAGYRQYLYARPAVAYVSFDSEGSIELEVNDRGLVRDAKAFDESGALLLSSVQYRMKPVEQVIESLISRQESAAASPQSAEKGIVIALVPAVPDMSGAQISDKSSDKTSASAIPGAFNQIERKIAEQARKTAERSTQTEGDRNQKVPPVVAVRLDHETRELATKLGMTAGRAAASALSQNGLGKLGPANAQSSGTEHEPIVEAREATKAWLKNALEARKQERSGARQNPSEANDKPESKVNKDAREKNASSQEKSPR